MSDPSASGLLLGAVASVPPSRWLFVAACFCGAFVAAGTRLVRLMALSHGGGRGPRPRTDHRRGFLRHVLAMSSAGAVLAYCLWALRPPHELWPAAGSVVTLTLFFLRYALLIDQARAGPARRIERDRPLGALALLWVALFVGAGYL